MKKLIFIILFIMPCFAQAQDILYSRHDSLFITNLLHKYHASKMPAGKQIMAIAGEFMGCKYVAGTLEKGNDEPLVIDTKNVDCTTFVELVIAIYATIKEGKNDFDAVCRNLQRIRYRGGTRNGYASRLHYISQWITDSAKQHIIREVNYGCVGQKQSIELSYMSSHPASYPLLKNDSTMVQEIEKWEHDINGTVAYYIPKKELNRPADELPVKEGDIIALTTNIKGLDVTHMGFAFWKDGRLHLLHASSISEKVIKENCTLYEYQKNKKSQTGIRVFRAE